MEFWQSTFATEAEHLIDVAKLSEDLGFDGVMVSDHLLHFEECQSRYPYSEDGTPPWFQADTVWPESWSIIAALGAVTERVKFVTNVYILPLRNPIEVAKATASAATFCEGRVAVGAGAGWMKEEFDVLGVDFKTRGKRFDECIEVMRKLWTGRPVEHHGEFFDFPSAQMCPVPKQAIPIYIGGMSRAALRRAARLGDGWIGAGQSAIDAIATVDELNKLRVEAGRSHEPFDTIVALNGEPEVDELKRLRDAGVGGVVSYPFVFTIGPTSTFEQKRAHLEWYANEVMAKVRS